MKETFLNTSAQVCLPFEDTPLAKGVKTMAYVVVILASLIGNSVMILVIFRAPRMRTTTNYLIANMAVSDLLLPIFAIPRMVVGVLFGFHRWFVGGGIGLALCKLIPLLQDISTAVSIQSLVFIAVERFYNVFYPVKAAVMSSNVPKIVLPITWLAGLLLHSPYFFIFNITVENNRKFCLLDWSPLFDDKLKAEKVYFILVFTLLIVIPVSVIAVLYTAIVLRLKKQQFPSQHQTENTRRLREKRNSAVMKLSVVIVLVFVLCWTPFDTYVFLQLFKWTPPLCGLENTAFAVTFVAHSISALNPCIYFLYGSSYRQGLKEVFPCVSRIFSSSRVSPIFEMRHRTDSQ